MDCAVRWVNSQGVDVFLIAGDTTEKKLACGVNLYIVKQHFLKCIITNGTLK